MDSEGVICGNFLELENSMSFVLSALRPSSGCWITSVVIQQPEQEMIRSNK